MWYSYDQKNFIYYDIEYNEATGTMKGYKDQERTEELSNRAFSYTFTPATEQYDAIVELTFDDGQRYGGMLIPKGNLQISNKDVYMIQLYEINDKGAIIYDENGKTVLENQTLNDALAMYNWDIYDMQEGTSPHRTNMDPAVSAMHLQVCYKQQE